MKKTILMALLLFCGMLHAQNEDHREINTEFAEKINHVFQHLEKERVPYGLLLDYAFEFTDLAAYNGTITDTNAVHLGIYKEIYNTLLMAQVNRENGYMYNPEEFKSRWNNLRQSANLNTNIPYLVLSGLYFKYARFAPTAVAQGKISIENGQIHDAYRNGIWQNPYEVKETFAISAPVMQVNGLQANISLPEALFYSNQINNVAGITADFGDGNGYRSINFGTSIHIQYNQEGIYTWRFKLHLNNGAELEAHTRLIFKARHNIAQDEYEEEHITATKSYQGLAGSASLQIIDRNADGINNPLIVAEGFDPAILEPEREYGINNLGNFLTSLNESNNLRNALDLYDIIYVNWDDSFAYIQRNAYVLEEVINWVNQEKTGNNPNVVLGQSMGGLAARYALKDMENNNENHDTWLYVSHDAPHQGANVPLGFQYLDRHVFNLFVQSPLLENLVVGIADGAAVLYDVQTMFDAPSARQMLIYHVKGNCAIDNSMHVAWQNELENIGYPQQTRNIAISNGNHCAATQPFSPGDELFRVKGSIRSGWLSDLLLTVFPLANNFLWAGAATITYEPGFLLGILPGNNEIKADFWAKALPQNGSEPIYRGFMSYTKKILWLIPITVHITNRSFNSPSNALPYDYYPGGKYETPVDIESQEYQNSLVQYNIDGAMQGAFCFIPTPSALDLGNNLTDNLYLRPYTVNNVPAPSSGLYIPFNNFATSYNVEGINEVHISFNTRNGNWLADELLIQPEVFDCSFVCNDTMEISGSSTLCDTAAYSIAGSGNGLLVNWYITEGSDLVTLSNTGNSTTLTVTPGDTGYVTLKANVASAFCDRNITKTKRIFVGEPEVGVTRLYAEEYCDIKYHYLMFRANSTSDYVSYDWLYPINFPGAQFYDYGKTFKVGIPKNNYANFAIGVTVANSCGDDSGSWSGEIVQCNNNNYNNMPASENISITPNPVNAGTLNVQMPESEAMTNSAIVNEVNIYDLSGNLEFTNTYSGSSFSITNLNLSQGSYILNVTTSENTSYQQLILVE